MCQWVKRLQHPSGTSAEDTYWIGTIRHCFTLFRFCVASSKSSANNVFLCTNKESKTMGVLDNDYIRIKEKPWLISLVCTIFVVYPNVAWLYCELTFLSHQEQLNFILFTLFRFLFFWAFIWGAIRYNFMRLSTPHFLRRLGWNSLITLVAFLVYMVITHLTQNYDRFLSILVFQFIVMCLLNTLVLLKCLVKTTF